MHYCTCDVPAPLSIGVDKIKLANGVSSLLMIF